VHGEKQRYQVSIAVAEYWQWKCEECGHEFTLSLKRMPEPCHRCGGYWFLKIGESDTKEREEHL
jgi:rRNA maturation endonuclease Nob1